MREIIDANLNELGDEVLEACELLGYDMQLNEEGRLDVADAAALLDHEGAGGQNIFGCDWGPEWAGQPPYCGDEVTAERVAALLENIRQGGGQNGVGPSQLTTVEYVLEADRRGGAHIPRHNAYVGLKWLQWGVDLLGYRLGIAAYNAGPNNPQLGITNGYFAKIQAARQKWAKLLEGAEPEKVNGADKHPTTWVIKDAKGWAVDPATGNFIRARERPNSAFASDPSGWMYPESRTKRVVGPAPRPGSYVDEHPTRFGWRRPVANLTRRIEAEYDVFICTYHEHPPGIRPVRDFDSFDVWGPEGRGHPISSAVGNAILNSIWYDPNPPHIEWCIFERVIYSAANNWRGAPWGDGPFTWHDDHLHVTTRR